MFGILESSLRLLALLTVSILSASCALNSFQATVQVSEWRLRAGQPGEFQEMEDQCKPGPTKDQNAFVLIHGIYGNEYTFDRLQRELKMDSDLGRSSIYLMEYWSNKFFPNFQSLAELGRAFKARVEEVVTCRDPDTIIIIAHSQGGLIAKEAVLGWKEIEDDKGKEILKKTKLVLIGTPNSFSTYAAYNNIFVNSLFAPITWATGIFSVHFGKAFVYNRQAFDMADNIFPELTDDPPGSYRSRFMLNHIAKWGERFPSGVMDNPKAYAIVGVKDVFNNFSLNDGIVHSDTLLFAGIPAQRVHYVPYRHWEGEVAVDNEHHRTFKVIKSIVLGKFDETYTTRHARKFAQKLSPLKDLPYSITTFVMEDNHSNIQLEGIRLETENSPISGDGKEPGHEEQANDPMVDIEKIKRTYREINRRLDKDSSADFLEFIGRVLALPFQTLQGLMYPVVNEAERRAGDSAPGKWEIKYLPTPVLDGNHEGIIKVRNRETGWLFGMLGAEVGSALYTITDDPSDPNAVCMANYQIIWESSTNSSLPDAKKSTQKISLQQNAVNYIKVEVDNDAITLTRVGCG